MERKIGLNQIMDVFCKKLRWILFSMIICGGLAWGLWTIFIGASYTANVSLYIYSNVERGQETDITTSEIDASQLLADTCIVILESDTVMMAVKEALGTDIELDALKDKINASSVNNTEIISISVKDKDPQEAQKIANTIAEIFPEKISQIIKAGGAEVVDYARMPADNSLEESLFVILMSMLFGFLFSSGVFMVKKYFAFTMEKTEDLKEIFADKIPILGTIPMILDEKERRDEITKKREKR